MYIKIEYNNGKPDFELNIETDTDGGLRNPVFNLEVEGKSGRSRKVAIIDYVMNLEMAYRELINMHETSIKSLIIDDGVFGKIKKEDKDIEIIDRYGKLDVETKFDTILYNVYSSNFYEKAYFTRNGSSVRKTDVTFEGNNINTVSINNVKHLLTNVNDMQRFVMSLKIVFKTYLKDYTVKLDKASNSLQYYYKGSKLMDINDITRDDIFIFFKLLEVISHREPHMGVFFIDCSNLTANVINAMTSFILMFFNSRKYIYLYNVSNSVKAKLQNKVFTIELPNQKL